MTKHIAPLPDPDGSLLLRELIHRVNNELTSTIGTIFSQSGAHDEGGLAWADTTTTASRAQQNVIGRSMSKLLPSARLITPR